MGYRVIGELWSCNEFIIRIGRINYDCKLNKLWKRLIDLNMSKTQLREKAGITTNAIAKMGKNENVSTEIICKICKVLECQVEDVIELVDEEEKEVC